MTDYTKLVEQLYASARGPSMFWEAAAVIEALQATQASQSMQLAHDAVTIECLNDKVLALQGEVERLKQEWNRFHHLLKNHGLHPGRTDDDLLVILEAALAKLDELQRQEPVGEVRWAANIPNSIRETYFFGDEPPVGTKLYAAPKALEPLTDEQKQRIHDETGAGHSLICLVESYICEITKGTP